MTTVVDYCVRLPELVDNALQEGRIGLVPNSTRSLILLYTTSITDIKAHNLGKGPKELFPQLEGPTMTHPNLPDDRRTVLQP